MIIKLLKHGIKSHHWQKDASILKVKLLKLPSFNISLSCVPHSFLLSPNPL